MQVTYRVLLGPRATLTHPPVLLSVLFSPDREDHHWPEPVHGLHSPGVRPGQGQQGLPARRGDRHHWLVETLSHDQKWPLVLLVCNGL